MGSVSVEQISTLIGYGGAALIALAYLLNQAGRLASEDWRFPASNLLGSALIGFSLFYSFNAPSLVVELFWSSISVYGLWRNLRRRI